MDNKKRNNYSTHFGFYRGGCKIYTFFELLLLFNKSINYFIEIISRW